MKIYNVLTGQKELFTPITPGQLNLYVCGVTVYDYCHIGHARTYTTFDVLVRFFKFLGYEVNYVRNITDIDDKIIKRAEENKETPESLVQRFIKIMHEEFARLNFLEPSQEPTATGTIPEIISMVNTLISEGFAYQAANQDVYFRVRKFHETQLQNNQAGYGVLSGQNMEALQIGARVEIDGYKEEPLDFVLWKSAKPGEPAWESPFGLGRPGWHIECSAMSKKCLGSTFDIHGGGSDLCFPHHENEIAQSIAANKTNFAHYWVHSGMVQINNQKMAKSLGNFFIIRDVLKNYSAEVIRYFLTCSHYRSQINYSEENLNLAQAALTRFYTALRHIKPSKIYTPTAFTERFIKSMEDDLNVPEALSVLFDLAREINKLKNSNLNQAELLAAELVNLGHILGLLNSDPEEFLKNSNLNNQNLDSDLDSDLDSKINLKIQERADAKKSKNFALADLIRQELLTQGIILEDSASGTSWRKTL